MKWYHLLLPGILLAIGMEWGDPSYKNLPLYHKIGVTLLSAVLGWGWVGYNLAFYLACREKPKDNI